MNRTKKLIMSLLAVLVLGLAATAQAQDTPPPASPPPSSGGGGGSSISLSGGAGLGIGATIPLTGSIAGQFFPVGNVVYDTHVFHIEGLFGFQSQPNPGTDRTTAWEFGAGGWYHLHRGASSDFSLGGVIAISYISAPGGSATLTTLEPGINARAFVTSNVAVFARGGLAVLLGDTAPGGGANFYLGGQPSLLAGFTYFFR